MKKPKRCYQIVITVGGDTWKDAVRLLKELTDEAAEHGPECKMVSGGASAGGYVKVEHDPDMTNAMYQAALEEYREYQEHTE